MSQPVSVRAVDYDLAVIGAGPAAQAACLSLGGQLKIAVLDEQIRAGGQILRQPPVAMGVKGWMDAPLYRALKQQLDAFGKLENVEFRGGHSVLGLQPITEGWRVTFSNAAGAGSLSATRVLIATGCYDMAVPLKGWTLPGVMSAGGVQAFVKSQQFVPGHRIAFAGTHPLQLVAAEQALKAGASVAVVAFAQPFAKAVGEVLKRPHIALLNLPKLFAVMSSAMALRFAGVPLLFGQDVAAIEGADSVNGLSLNGGYRTDCDAVALCYGFMPQSDLPRATGLDVAKASPAGWQATHDEWQRGSLRGVFVAGETTGVKGADAAMAEGAVAGLGIAVDAGLIDAREARSRAARWRRRFKSSARFSQLLSAVADPGPFASRLPEGDVLVCRCEDVSLGQLQSAIGQCRTASGVKLATRCGMGGCQGRNCEHNLLDLIGGCDTPAKGFRARFPARPVRIGDLASR